MTNNTTEYSSLVTKLTDTLALLDEEAPHKRFWEDFEKFQKTISEHTEAEIVDEIIELERYIDSLQDDLDRIAEKAHSFYENEIKDHSGWLRLSV